MECTNWAFDANENSTIAIFQINKNKLIIYTSDSGWYIPEGEKGANMQCWSSNDDDNQNNDVYHLQAEFESTNSADDIAKICELQKYIDEIELYKKDSNYEFIETPDDDSCYFCKSCNPE